MILYYHTLQEPEQKTIESTFLRRIFFFFGGCLFVRPSRINNKPRGEKDPKKTRWCFFSIIGEAFKDLVVIVFFGILKHSGFRNMLFCKGILTIGVTKAFKQDPCCSQLKSQIDH